MHTIGLLFARPTDRRLLAEFLQESQYEVRTEAPPKGQLEHWKDASLIIADERAARYYDQELLRMRWRVPTSFFPLLIALSKNQNGVPWLRAGFNDVLRLPIKKAELQARLAVFLELRERSEKQYQAFFENALVGLYRMTLDGDLLMANPALLGLLGHDSADALARSEDRRKIGPGAHRSAFTRQLRQSGEVIGHESTWTRADGSTAWTRENATVVRLDNLDLVYCEGTVEDVTDRRRAEQALREAKEAAEATNRAKSTFLANMSHEVRTPLTGIMGFASLLKKQDLGPQLKYVQVIERNGKRLMDTLGALLTLAKLEADRVDMDLKPMCVAEEAERVTRLFRPAAEEKGLGIRHVAAPEAQQAHAVLDPGALNSVLQNLISNAVKFTTEGHITVTTFVPDSASATGPAHSSPHVCLRIKDTGSGIDPDFAARIFEPFEQESSGLTRLHEGSGLGLAIAKQLTEAMNGTIEVESEKGKGSAFTVAFPLAQNASSPDVQGEGARALSEGTRVLVVEDNQDTRELIEIVLRNADVSEVYTAGTVEEAVEQTERCEKAFDLVLVDINLGTPEGGLEILKRLRAQAAYTRVPLVAMTAYAMPGDRERFLSEGFDAYLSKPFTVDELMEMAAEQLAK